MVLNTLGLANSLYLIRKHHENKPLVCPLNHDCSIVTESKWSHFFFIRNEILGMLFFIVMFTSMLIAIFLPAFTFSIFLLSLIGTSLGTIFSIFLILIQVYVIKDYCFYCILSASIIMFMFFNSLILYATQ